MVKSGVLQIIDSLNVGGAEVLSINIANLLNEKGYNSHICVTREEGILKKSINKNVGYFFMKRKKTFDIKSIVLLKKYVKKNKIKIVHAHSTSLFTAFCLKMFYFKINIVWHDHYGKSQDLQLRPFVLIKMMSFFVKAIISVNSNLKKWAKEKLNCKKVYFLNNFCTFNNYKTITFLKGEKGKRVIHLAAFRAQKDHENLIEAFQFFLKRHSDWTLHLVGKIHDDEYSSKILEIINSKSLKNNIFFYGARLDIKHILEQSTIGVLSSKSEGLPISLLEYGLAKLPVVITDVGECSKVISHNESGFLVEPSNEIEFSNALSILAESKPTREKFMKNLNSNIIENYSDYSFFKNLISIYNSLF